MSPQARTFFKKLCREVALPELKLTQYVRTRWASLYNTLDRFIKLQPAVTHFIQLVDDSEEVPTLKNKRYADFRLGKCDWEHLALIHEVLKVIMFQFPSSCMLTLNRNLPVPRNLFQALLFQLSGVQFP